MLPTYRECYIIGGLLKLFLSSGHYVPELSQLIYRKNKGIQNPSINFKGFMVKNYNLLFYCLIETVNFICFRL